MKCLKISSILVLTVFASVCSKDTNPVEAVCLSPRIPNLLLHVPHLSHHALHLSPRIPNLLLHVPHLSHHVPHLLH